MSLTSAADNLGNSVSKAQEALAKADEVVQKHQFRPEHWDALTAAEQKFENLLTSVDSAFPDSNKGRFKELEGQITLLAIFGVIFMVGSVAVLWFMTRDKIKEEPKQKPKPEKNSDYEYAYVNIKD